MAKPKKGELSQKQRKEHTDYLVREAETDVMVSDKGKQFQMAVGQSLHNVLKLREIGIGKVSSDEEMVQRLEQFFNRCVEMGQIPTIEKACVTLGMTTSELRRIKDGSSQGFSLKTKEIINELYSMCGAIANEMALSNSVNPIIYIFLAKNHFGLTDKQELVITPNNSIEATESVEVIEAKYNELPTEEFE